MKLIEPSTNAVSNSAPLFDPVADEKDAKAKDRKTRKKSAYDVCRRERKDLLPAYEEEAKSLYPEDKSLRQAHINICYAELVNGNKEYWMAKALEANEKAADDSDRYGADEEEEDTRTPRKQ